MRMISDDTVKTSHAAVLQMLRDAESHAATPDGLRDSSDPLWLKMVAELRAAATELSLVLGAGEHHG